MAYGAGMIHATGTRPGLVSPLATWFSDEGAVRRFRRHRLSRAPTILPPRDRAWRLVVPGFGEAVALAGSGIPFQIAADRQYDRSGDPRRLGPALATGATVFLPQVHQVLPRLARLMVALRHALCGPSREECSFLFAVEGSGRAGMGLHHDDEVDSFWLQLEGQRTVTVGPPVLPGTPLDLDDRLAAGALPLRRDWRGSERRRPPGRRGRAAEGGPGLATPPWWTAHLRPGTLFHLPPRTPHRVVCHGRSLAVSLTWGRRARASRGSGRRTAVALAAWDVVSGYVDSPAAPSLDRVFVQVPAIAGPSDATGRARLWTGDARATRVPGRPRRVLDALGRMPSLTREAAGLLLGPLLEAGILAPADLPLRIRPGDPRTLDGWRFA
jgi:hypothetical protein